LYTKEEVERLVWKFHKQQLITSGGLSMSRSGTEKWMKDNL